MFHHILLFYFMEEYQIRNFFKLLFLIYSRRQYKVSLPSKKTCCPTAYQRFKKRNCLPFLRSQFLRTIFRLTPPKSINRRAEVIDELERNWREEKRLIDEKSINNRRTEAEWSTRRAETIGGTGG